MRAALIILAALILNVVFLNTESVDPVNRPVVTEVDWQMQLMSNRMSPTVAGTSSYEINTERGNVVGLARSTVVVNEPGVPDKIFSVSPSTLTSAEAIFSTALSDIKDWQEANPEKTAQLIVGNGVYNFTNTNPKYAAVLVSDMHRLHITGQIVEGTRPKFIISNLRTGSIKIENSSLIKISGLDIEYKLDEAYGPHIAYRGRVVAANTVESVDLPAAYAGSIQSVRSFDATRNTWIDLSGPVKRNAHSIPQLTAPLTSLGNSRYSSPDLGVFQLGESVLLIHSRIGYGGGVLVTGETTSDITIQGIHLSNYLQMGIRIENAGRGFRIVGNRLLPKDGEILSGRADGIHVTGTLGDVVIERNIVACNGDDGINIRGTDVTVSSVFKTVDSKLRATISTEGAGFLADGDRVAMMATGDPLGLADVRKIDATTVDLSLTPTCDSRCLDSVVAALESAMRRDRARLFNLTHDSSRFLIRENRFFRTGARGILVQTSNGTVRDNVIYHPAAQAIFSRLSDGVDSEGPGPVNVLVEGNRIHGSNYYHNEVHHTDLNAAIVMTTVGREGDSFNFVQRGLLRRNCISGSGQSAMILNNTRAMEVAENTIGTFNQMVLGVGTLASDAVITTNSVGVFRYPDVMNPRVQCAVDGP